MELDDLKNTWNEAASGLPKQQNVNPEMLERLRGKQYHSKIKKIIIPEIIGSIICLAAAFFIAFRFGKLDSILLQSTGIVAILILLLLPIISALSTRQLSAAGNPDKPYTEALKAFAVQRIRFVKLQKINIVLSYLLLVTIIVLLSKLFGGKDLFSNKYFWLFSFTTGYAFLLFYAKWVEQWHKKVLQQSEDLLRELAA